MKKRMELFMKRKKTMSKTRNVFLAILVCVVMLFATACGNKSDTFKHGSWSGVTYTSKFLGIKIQLGSDWMVFSEEIIAEAVGISDMSDSNIRTVFDEGRPITEMSALRSDASSISITVQDNDTAGALSGQDFFSEENISRLKADFEGSGAECTVYKDTVRFLGKDTDCIDLSYSMLNISSCEIIIPVFISHYTAMITFSANSRSDLPVLIGMVTAI